MSPAGPRQPGRKGVQLFRRQFREDKDGKSTAPEHLAESQEYSLFLGMIAEERTVELYGDSLKFGFDGHTRKASAGG
jgi:hypothetical protein